MIALTLITSKTVITKKFRLRGQALEKMQPGAMYAGHAESLEVPDLQALIPIINGMNTRQALAYGTIAVPGDRHRIVTKDRQIDGQTISRSRKFFEFKEGQEGILLIDYDPPKNEKPLNGEDVMQMLGNVCPAIDTSEKLIISSASSYLYRKSDNECLKGAGGLHILVRVENAAEIPEIGKALNARLWLSGFGYIGKTEDGKDQVRSLIDTGVWQPERLSYECGSECGAGLEQRKPAIQHSPGGSLCLEAVEISAEDLDKYNALVAAAKGQKPGKTPQPRNPAAIRREQKAHQPVAVAPVEPLTPHRTARIMRALLHVPAECDYQTWLKIGMALKTGCGDAGFALWDNWSKVASSYPGAQSLRAKWLSFDGNQVTLKTLFFHAKQHGWTGKAARIEPPLPIENLTEDQHETLAESVTVGRARTVTLQHIYKLIVSSRESGAIDAAQVTVGVGKTTALKQIFEDIKRAGLSVTVVVKDKQQCREYEKAGAFWRHGREFTEEGFTPESMWHCPKIGDDGPVSRLAEQEHRLATMCRSGHCEHGNKMMLARAETRNESPAENIVQFFKERPEMRNAPACGWFDHMDESKGCSVRVVTSKGLSPADMVDANGKNIDYLVIDEALEWSHSQFLGVPEIRGYIETLQQIAERDKLVTGVLETPIAVFQQIAEHLGKRAGNGSKGAYYPVNFDIAGCVEKLNAALEDGVALWEKPVWKHWLDLVQAPLRALSAIKDGISAGSLSVTDGQLHLTYLHPVLSVAIEKKIPVLILDATLDQTARGFVPGERVQRIVSNPNVEWKIDPRWFLSAKNDDAHLLRESGRLLTLRKKQQTQTKRDSYIICRKTLALFLLQRETGMTKRELFALDRDALWSLSIAMRIGWWGWHDAAHDKWHGLNGILWGQIPTPESIRMQEYMNHRAAMLLTGQITTQALPLADNMWSSGQMVRTGDHLQESMARLPVQPEVREWLLGTVSGSKIQAAGRSRATCQTHLVTIWQVGGYPTVGLAEHGIRPVYARLVAGLSGREVAAIHAAQRAEFTSDAAAAVIAGGAQVTRERVRKMTAAIGISLKSLESSDANLVRDGYIYIYQLRTKKEGLDVKENNDLDEVAIVNAGSWNDEYTAWRMNPPPGVGRHFAHEADPAPEAEKVAVAQETSAQQEPIATVVRTEPDTIHGEQTIRANLIADMREWCGAADPASWFRSQLQLEDDPAIREALQSLITGVQS